MYLSKPTLLCGLTFNCVKSQMKYIPLSAAGRGLRWVSIMVRQRHRSWKGASVIEGRRGGVSETVLHNVRQPANATANGSQGVRARDAAGVTPEMSLCLSAASRRKSHSTCMPCQNWSDWSKKAPKRIDIAGVMERLPCTISLIALGETPMARDMAFCEMPMGLSNLRGEFRRGSWVAACS